jgi:hypothetical protein
MLAPGIDRAVVRSFRHYQHAASRAELDGSGRCAAERHDDPAALDNAAVGSGWHDDPAAEPDAACTLGCQVHRGLHRTR